MRVKSVLSLLLMLLALVVTTFSCKKEKSSTPTNPINPSQNEIIGYINGLYSVTPNTQVCFSKGNLQYQASTNTWRFAENQWDIIGDDNANLSSDYDGWIDLFGWGTSGYNHGAVCYQPWSTSINNDDYNAYGTPDYSLFDSSGQADWGFNPISNGGNTENQWFTLTRDEWKYVLDTRNTESGIRYAKASVNGINGLLLLPDNWNDSIYYLNDVNTGSSIYDSNIIDSTAWTNAFEANGVVFLPASGNRAETWVSDVNSETNYWSATSCVNGWAYSVSIDYNDLDPTLFIDRALGVCVRLVHTVE